MDVVLLRWPAERVRRDELAAADRPRLLLVEAGSPPPEVRGLLEDWIRTPAAEADVRARVETLARRAAGPPPGRPSLDADGVVRLGGRWVALPPVEARLTEALLGRFGAVVGRDALAEAGWPSGPPGRNALDVHILRLRRRIVPLGLAITTVRGRGYLLEVDGPVVDPGPQRASDPVQEAVRMT